jgi:hypothetical protein
MNLRMKGSNMRRLLLSLPFLTLAMFASQAAEAANVVEPTGRWPASSVEVVICDRSAGRDLDRLCRRQPGADKMRPRRIRSKEATTVRAAIAKWNDTFERDIRFREVDKPSGDDAIVFRVSSHRFRCSTSRVGFLESKPTNYISVGSRCNSDGDDRTRVGSILHEMMHAVGVFHEQERRDRPAYVTINSTDTNLSRWGLACKRRTLRCEKGARGTPVGEYDFSSIMHYSFDGRRGKTSQLTNLAASIAAQDDLSLDDIGQREGLSAGDVEGVKFVYGSSAWPPVAVK